MLPKRAWDRVVKSPRESQKGNNRRPMAFLLAARRGVRFSLFKSLILTHPKLDRLNASEQFSS
jgi:hypothetical protein